MIGTKEGLRKKNTNQRESRSENKGGGWREIKKRKKTRQIQSDKGGER